MTQQVESRPEEQAHVDTDRSERGQLWAVIARRELAVKLTDRSFLISTAVSLVLILGLIGMQAWLDSRTHDYRVAVSATEAEAVAEVLVDQAPELDDSIEVEEESFTDDASARAALEEEDVDAWLQPPAADGGPWTLVGREAPDDRLQAVLEDVLQQQALTRTAEDAGTTLDRLLEGTEVVAEPLEGDAELAELRDILGFALAFLFYISTIMFGMTLANSVVEEKQSRIVEMIAAAVPLRQLLAGKIAGNTVLALAQLVLYLAVGTVALSFTDFGSLLPAVSGELGWFVVFFLVGFVALSCVWAVAGALASRTEDLQHTSGPVTMLVLGMFFGALFLEGTAEQVGSYVPPLSALLMPIRLVSGTASWWEPLVALALLVGFAAVLVLVAERLYRRALLQTGGRLTIRQAWRLEE